MSNVQNFLAPFSHLLFWNRNADIVVLCFILFFVAIIALQNYWRSSRLERELTAARQNASVSPVRRYTSAPAAPEPPVLETGGPLPPVKGGRSYARNLGSALQKAGMSQPIYSPPTPPGWSPQPSHGQPAGQPGMGAPYAAPNVPWAATPPTAPTPPWALPAGGGRNLPGPAPNVPFYQPPQTLPGAASQPTAPAPNVYMPPSPGAGAFPPPAPVTGPFAPPAFSAPPPSGLAMPAPSFSPPVPSPMVSPAPAVPVPTPDQSATDGGRRGKPKRRRFNFNVLENLEKMVQTKPAVPPPASGWTPPPAPPAAPPIPQAGPAAAPTPAQATFSAIPATPPASAPSSPSVVPAFPTSATSPSSSAETTPAPTEPAMTPKPLESASAPGFLFGKRTEDATASASVPEPTVSEPVLDFAAPAVEEMPAPAAEEPTESAAPAPQPEAAPAEEETPVDVPKPDARRSMRSMMFGEEASASEPAAAPSVEPATPEPVTEEPVASSAGADDASSAWPSYSWNRREESGASTAAPPNADQAPAESDHQEEAVAEAPASDTYQPWKAGDESETVSWKSAAATEAEPAVEETPAPVAESTDGPGSAQEPEVPAAESDDQPGAGAIVIIEDDQTAASYYATLFKGNGYRVEVANDGVSGVDLCARVQPQVILLDVMMPRQNGILVLQTLRASDETKNTPVVVMSNFSEPTLIKRALQLGALEYVIKTQVEGSALLNALPRWMNREKAFAAA